MITAKLETTGVSGLCNIRLATMSRGIIRAYGLVEDAVLLIHHGRILWCGEGAELPDEYKSIQLMDGEGRLVTPGFIDCHTHLVFGGDRAREFELRLEGASYEEISRSGGGIRSTVKATRTASEKQLLAEALKRVDHLIAEGVTTLEIKSGYGLDLDTELKMLRVARAIGTERDVLVQTTFLGAHAVPEEFDGRSDAFIDHVVNDMLPRVAGEKLADAVDGFCEGIAFNPAQIERVFAKSKELGLPVKLHAEQLSNLGGAAMAARNGALSADHLEYLDEAGVVTLAECGTVAVLLPGAFYTLREKQYPPISTFRKHNVPIAIATDANPGSSPLTSILLVLNMACTIFRMTPEEALAGVTRNAALALGLGETHGTVEVGKIADLAIWDVREPAELAYRIGFNPLHKRITGSLS
ncbi:MAG: imidazolonepropionase [Cohaesibacteraceae bacterium]|nr:imidazolonepropionase [Cohaesibacteraceae bacterium]